MFAEATIKLKIGDTVVHEVSEGSGPVHALDGAFHKALNPHFPLVRDVHLADYKVRILDPDAATRGAMSVVQHSASPKKTSCPAPSGGPRRWSCRWSAPPPPAPSASAPTASRATVSSLERPAARSARVASRQR